MPQCRAANAGISIALSDARQLNHRAPRSESSNRQPTELPRILGTLAPSPMATALLMAQCMPKGQSIDGTPARSIETGAMGDGQATFASVQRLSVLPDLFHGPALDLGTPCLTVVPTARYTDGTAKAWGLCCGRRGMASCKRLC
mmetsp:Transcript_23367/g.59657  ORF Transcript_23367/g.59657 Transcript_23367/m.59657 type:complete len:144 (-) Transcript_23367:339-770(-)